MKVLITSGGTKIKVDLVRSITNMSKGSFGAKICEEFVRNKHVDEVIFLMAEDSKFPEIGSDYDLFTSKIKVRKYVTFEDYQTQLNVALGENPDIVVLAAAVSDYGVENFVNGKIRSADSLTIHLKPLPKLISTVRGKLPKAVICGFKLLVDSTEEELLQACKDSLYKNDIDLVIGNDLKDIKANNHTLHICWKTKNGIDYQVYEKEGSDLAQQVMVNCFNYSQIPFGKY